MNTWQRIGDTPELFTVAYDNATNNTVRAVVIQYRGGGRWRVKEATYKGRIAPTMVHEAIWHHLTPQEKAICALQFGSASTKNYAAFFLDMSLSDCLRFLEIPESAARVDDRASHLW